MIKRKSSTFINSRAAANVAEQSGLASASDHIPEMVHRAHLHTGKCNEKSKLQNLLLCFL